MGSRQPDPPHLLDRIRDEIRRGGPITFARFMELALYDSAEGYYSAGARRIGPAGDFITNSDVGSLFGACLARQLREIDRHLGARDPFHILEFGAGRGLLASDVLECLGREAPELSARTDYVMAERSEGMRRAASAVQAGAVSLPPERLPREVDGCIVAVELFDALPVHRVRRRAADLLEILVGTDVAGRLVEIESAASDEVASWARRYGAAAEDGTEAEVCLGAEELLDRMSETLNRGWLLIFDYGDTADRLYVDRPRGTLLAYHRHATSEDYLERVGLQDLTAHVNFTALADLARERGMRVVGWTTQDRFLIANGILTAFEQAQESAVHEPAAVKRRLQALQLIHPSGMGRTFKLLALSKGFDDPPPLSGLVDPFAHPGRRPVPLP